jgi:hypothetical protein
MVIYLVAMIFDLPSSATCISEFEYWAALLLQHPSLTFFPCHSALVVACKTASCHWVGESDFPHLMLTARCSGFLKPAVFHFSCIFSSTINLLLPLHIIYFVANLRPAVACYTNFYSVAYLRPRLALMNSLFCDPSLSPK